MRTSYRKIGIIATNVGTELDLKEGVYSAAHRKKRKQHAIQKALLFQSSWKTHTKPTRTTTAEKEEEKEPAAISWI